MRNHDFTVFCCLFIVKGSRFKVYGSRGAVQKVKVLLILEKDFTTLSFRAQLYRNARRNISGS